jgi:hypothetical protein
MWAEVVLVVERHKSQQVQDDDQTKRVTTEMEGAIDLLDPWTSGEAPARESTTGPGTWGLAVLAMTSVICSLLPLSFLAKHNR